jgi:hypothetical protein
VIWLNNLAQDLKTRGALEEAAQCKFYVAALVIGYMALLKPQEALAIDLDSAFKCAHCPSRSINSSARYGAAVGVLILCAMLEISWSRRRPR